MKIARGVIGYLAGYAVVVVITTVGFGMLHGFKPYYKAGPAILLAAISVAVSAGFFGGASGALIAGNRWVGAAIAIPLIVESTWLIFLRAHPAEYSYAFEITGASTLIASTIIGALLTSRIRSRLRQPSSVLSS